MEIHNCSKMSGSPGGSGGSDLIWSKGAWLDRALELAALWNIQKTPRRGWPGAHRSVALSESLGDYDLAELDTLRGRRDLGSA